jgi:Rod binding domain-containing protein
MKPDFANALGQIATMAVPASAASKSEKAARDFESVLLTSLFDSLEKSFAFDPQDSTPGAGDYRLMGTRALAEAVAAGGGIGIARLILRHLPVTKVSEGS